MRIRGCNANNACRGNNACSGNRGGKGLGAVRAVTTITPVRAKDVWDDGIRD